jgi:hypothetical protein
MLAAVVPSINGKWEVKEVPTPQVNKSGAFKNSC